MHLRLVVHGRSIRHGAFAALATRYPAVMSELEFPKGFLWGTATAAHQIEGDNANCDWWAWERMPGTNCREPSGNAIDGYTRHVADSKLIGGCGFNTYRFSVEWARIEPAEGEFDEAQLRHYREVAEGVRAAGMTPMVTLNHFTLPAWVAARGGWLWDGLPALFGRYCRRVVEAMGDSVDWYCTINEPGIVSFGGYMGALGFPPGTHGLKSWRRANDCLVTGHFRARDAIKSVRPAAKAGLTNSMQEWDWNAGGKPAVEFARHLMEDIFLDAAIDDDFLGVQAYSRAVVEMPGWVAPIARGALKIGPLASLLAGMLVNRQTGGAEDATRDPRSGIRRTDMGYEYRPQAIAATVARAAEYLPRKPLIVTENGIATKDDAERIEFTRDALVGLHALVERGVPLGGYIHWSAFDNFEWALGYDMQFGLIGVDRATMERQPKPSAKWLGEVAKRNSLTVP
jgi:beta-glucosidase